MESDSNANNQEQSQEYRQGQGEAALRLSLPSRRAAMKNHMTSTADDDVGKAEPLHWCWECEQAESPWNHYGGASQTKTGAAILFLFSKLISNKQTAWFRVMHIVPESKKKDCLQICPTTLLHHCLPGKCTLCLSCPVHCFSLIMLFIKPDIPEDVVLIYLSSFSNTFPLPLIGAISEL